MKMILKMLMTVNSRYSKPLLPILLTVVMMVMSLQVFAQRTVWSLPRYKETVRVGSVAFGNSFARDTYLSAISYSGWAIGLESDAWIGYSPNKLFRYGRASGNVFFSPLKNRLKGGSTLEVGGSYRQAFLWPSVACKQCDLLIGPVVIGEGVLLWNRQYSSNNPVTFNGYLGAGICVDNTFRFSLFRYPMALQASIYVPLTGIGFAPDYDQTYYYMYEYGDWGKTLHFVTPFNNPALTQQVALVLPCRSSRLRIGYSFDYMGNNLGGHTRGLGNGVFTLGCVYRFETKDWSL